MKKVNIIEERNNITPDMFCLNNIEYYDLYYSYSNNTENPIIDDIYSFSCELCKKLSVKYELKSSIKDYNLLSSTMGLYKLELEILNPISCINYLKIRKIVKCIGIKHKLNAIILSCNNNNITILLKVLK